MQPNEEGKASNNLRPAIGESGPGVATTQRPTEPRLEVASRCDVGAVRKRNEDASFTFVARSGGAEPLPLFGLFIVADGMGGYEEGQRASRVVSRTVAHHILKKLYWPLLREGSSAVQQPVQEVMEEAVSRANEALTPSAADGETGTTLTAALILGGRLFLIHVGDSRAYLLKDGELSLITRDHSVVQALQDAGQLSAEEAAVHPNRNLLYRALMGELLEPADVFTRSLPEKGTLLLCSDGLWGMVPDAKIEAILNADLPLQLIADRLLQEALDAGGSDNVTAIVARFEV